MPVAWHPRKRCDWYLPENEKKEMEPVFTHKDKYNVADIFSTKIITIINYQLQNGALN